MSTWRERFAIHPACDVFPMMTDDELDKLGVDILANGMQSPIICQDAPGDGLILLDGRNRLEALERVGLYDGEVDTIFVTGDPVSVIISANVHRRHMLKIERASAIVALAKLLAEKPGQRGPVSKGGRGQRDETKAKAIEINATLPKKEQASERTIKRAIAKAREPVAPEHPYAPGSSYEKQEKAAKKRAARKKRRATLQEYSQQLARLPKNLDGARWYYLQFVAKPGVDLNAEMTLIVDAIQNIVEGR